ncbi:hypothetical protein PVAP13_6KG333306 [Panicum virgatum]|uniref:Uncharacterized protein n=1 Tax=Panicum virgatum TaxID=38727 RepID=A0A8T0RFG1_PANVG|nr:hypothetical protein PVAP13_6KG333306 [Panicum virgatum]
MQPRITPSLVAPDPCRVGFYPGASSASPWWSSAAAPRPRSPSASPLRPGAPPLPIPGCCPRHRCSVPGRRAVRTPPRHPWPPRCLRAQHHPRPQRRPQAATASFTRHRRCAIHSAADDTGTLTVFTNEKGGAIDDSIITKVTDQHIYLVVSTPAAGTRTSPISRRTWRSSTRRADMSSGTSTMSARCSHCRSRTSMEIRLSKK